MVSRVGFMKAETDHLISRLALVLMSVHIKKSRPGTIGSSYHIKVEKKHDFFSEMFSYFL